MIYLDNAATTKTHEYVVRDMLPFLYGEYGNPSSVYRMGRTAAAAVKSARGKVAKFLHTQPGNIIFTSGGSEGNNMIIRGLADYMTLRGKTMVVTTPTEHPSVLRAADKLVKLGFDVKYLPVDANGVVSLRRLNTCIGNEVGLLSVMYVNNETGAVNPVKEIVKVCHDRGILVHSDCVQAAAAFDIDVADLGVDFATISGHKIHGPKGVGAVYVRMEWMKRILTPLVIGGEAQEYGLRGGTENVPGIVGLGTACELMEKPLDFRSMFLYELAEALRKLKSDARVYINSADNAVGNILNIEVDGVDAETLVLCMDTAGVCISAGSACHSKNVEPSHVLKAMGLSDVEARSSIRLSSSSDTKKEDVIEAAHIMADCIEKLRKIK